MLLVEDDPGDVLLIREAFEDDKVHNTLARRRATASRRSRSCAARARTPTRRGPTWSCSTSTCRARTAARCWPRSRATRDLRRIPVVVLTTSEAEEDVLRSYDLHANAYVTKPVDFDRFIDVVRQIDDFFVSVVKQMRSCSSRTTYRRRRAAGRGAAGAPAHALELVRGRRWRGTRGPRRRRRGAAGPLVPGRAGLETLPQRRARRRAPIVVLSGLDDEARRRAVREGAQDYLVKGQVDGAPGARNPLRDRAPPRGSGAPAALRDPPARRRERPPGARGAAARAGTHDPDLGVTTHYRAARGRPAGRRLLRRHRRSRTGACSCFARRRRAATARTSRRSASACGSRGARWWLAGVTGGAGCCRCWRTILEARARTTRACSPRSAWRRSRPTARRAILRVGRPPAAAADRRDERHRAASSQRTAARRSA